MDAEVASGDDGDFDPLYEAWYQREHEAFPGLFGTVSDGRKYGLLPAAFHRFGVRDVDPRWTNPGILVFGPSPVRRSTVYVSSGLSDPWDDVPTPPGYESVSGMGYELVLEVGEPSDWALELASKVLAYAVYSGWETPRTRMGHGSRIDLNSPIDGANSALRDLVLAKPTMMESSIGLDAGTVDLLHIVGITPEEREFAERTSSSELLDLLRANGAYPVVDPARRGLA